MSWDLQQLNSVGGNTGGPQTVSNPFVSVYNGQEHVGYRDSAGNIWDSFYRPDDGTWNLQQINNGGVTEGPTAVAGPFIGVYHDQQHFAYIDSAGNLWDSFYDGSGWNLQQLNVGGPEGKTNAPAVMTAAGPILVSIWNDPSDTQQHFTYRGIDNAVYDLFWDSSANDWTMQKLNNVKGNGDKSKTNGPAASGSPFGCVFHSQQHIGYNSRSKDIFDTWYDGNGNWNVQKINDNGRTSGHAAFAGTYPFVWVDPSNTQQHFTYLGNDQAIYDAFWDESAWQVQKITQQTGTTAGPGNGLTTGPKAVSAPAACVFNQQQHIGYRDAEGGIWDSWYDGSGNWRVQKINATGMTDGPLAGFDVFVWVTGQQQHFTYADPSGTIWDAYYSS